jgi:hypothetical protein
MLSYRECFQHAIARPRPCCAFSCMILSSLHRQHRLISLIIVSSKPKTTDKAASLLAAIQRTPVSAAEPEPPSPKPEPPAQSVTPAPAARQKAQPAKHVKTQFDLNKDLAMHWRNRPS